MCAIVNHICVHTNHPGSLWIHGLVRENGVNSNKKLCKQRCFQCIVLKPYGFWIWYRFMLCAYIKLGSEHMYIYRCMLCTYIVLCSARISFYALSAFHSAFRIGILVLTGSRDGRLRVEMCTTLSYYARFELFNVFRARPREPPKGPGPARATFWSLLQLNFN